MREACSVSPAGKRGPVLGGRFPISEALALERKQRTSRKEHSPQSSKAWAAPAAVKKVWKLLFVLAVASLS